jgi:hypothetical protein
MRIGWVGYNSLRREKMAPIGAVDQYYTLLPGLGQLAGEPVHWMPLKHLDPGCEVPDPAVAEEDELWVHQSVIHYADAFRPLTRWVNNLPTRGRMEAALNTHFDWSECKYTVPYLDVVIVEATGQMGAAYSVDMLLRQLWKTNPNIGYLIFDQDLASPTVKSKMGKWHPDPAPRQITGTHYLLDRYPTQAVTMTPHLDYRNWKPVVSDELRGVAYVGNDYKRREPMLRLMRGELFHHYGRLKDDFRAEFTASGAQVHGAFVPSKSFNIEHLYRYYGCGIHCLREDAYRLNLIAVRLSEIARAGCFAFVDKNFTIGRALSGEWAMVHDATEAWHKFMTLRNNPQFLHDMICYQQWALGHYTSSERYIESIFRCCQRLAQGPVTAPWKLNNYRDLMQASGLAPWG